VLVHTDAAQSVGKVRTKVDELEVDLMSIAGHKMYAPKGVGALFVRQSTAIGPVIHAPVTNEACVPVRKTYPHSWVWERPRRWPLTNTWMRAPNSSHNSAIFSTRCCWKESGKN
jgi:hypothetical protein